MTLTTFAANPATTVTRTLALARPAQPAQVEALRAVEGVVAVHASADGRKLAVSYDVRAMVMAALVKVAAGQGMAPASGPFARLGRALAGFQDDNLRAQANLVHHCCNTPPK